MHPKVLTQKAWRQVRNLNEEGLLDGWVLAGGSGMALHLGHRLSEDLDLFRPEEFDAEQLLDNLARAATLSVQDRGRSTLHVVIEGLRLSFLKADPPLLFPGIPYRGLSVADPRDIAVMKVVAIGGRGSRRDFVDLYFYLQAGGDLAAVLSLVQQRFDRIDYNEYHLRKSLVYFADAEAEPMPRMLKEAAWKEIKERIVAAVRALPP